MGKNVSRKRDLGLMKAVSLLGGRIYFHITDFDFSIEFFHHVRSHLI